jgi:uncharacterized protein YqjF (DUF2071 family)
MTSPSYRTILEQRLRDRASGPFDVRSTLRHFALINYALPAERLARYIPARRFEIPTFTVGGTPMALMSAVPFWDLDFRFVHLAPFLKFQFGQTNYRVYVIDRQTGEHVVWFFGTTLGSPLVHIARTLWGIPWHFARYKVDCRFNATRRTYDRFQYRVASAWAASAIRIRDTGEQVSVREGFTSPDEQQLILTHPVAGFYRRTDGTLGSYAVWHQEIPMTLGTPEHLYFSLYERLGLLSRAEMQQPHSIFLCPEIEFEVYLPPKRVGGRLGGITPA